MLSFMEKELLLNKKGPIALPYLLFGANMILWEGGMGTSE